MEELASRYPEFVAKCEQLGCKYTAYLGAEPDPAKGVGRGWKSFWNSQTKEAAEERMREFQYSYEWLYVPAEIQTDEQSSVSSSSSSSTEREILKCTTPILPAIRCAPGSQVRVFFNQLIAQIFNAQEWAQRALQSSDVSGGQLDPAFLDRFLTFGDGSSMDVEPLLFAKQLADDNAIEINWQMKDIALLDNYLVMHARRTFTGPRQVLASLVE